MYNVHARKKCLKWNFVVSEEVEKEEAAIWRTSTE
jgi:hypothetical protein